MHALIYDIEIFKAIPPKIGSEKEIIPGIEYCEGWHDHKNMGISVIGAYDYKAGRFRVFCKDNFHEFLELSKQRLMVGFNSIPFDDAVIYAEFGDDYRPADSYDILRETWAAADLGPNFQYPSHAGYSLDAIAKANNLPSKTGHGALAPVQWQRGEIGAVIDYCLQDVAITKRLFDRVQLGYPITCPKTSNPLMLREA